MELYIAMKKLLLALALLFPSGAWAQCTGVFPANTLCGNLSGSPAPPSAFSATSNIVGPGSSTIGDFATWANTGGTQLADTPSPLAVAKGGTGGGTASGTLLDNITAFASTGYLARTGAGTYTFTPTAGIPANTLNTQTANYTIATTDCGKTIQAGTGSTGFFAITVPAVAGFATNCTVTVTNGDTGRAKGLAGTVAGCAISFLYPGQSATISIVNGAWVNTVCPGRWKIPSAVTIQVNSSNGNDANDGLATGAGNAKATVQAALNQALNDFDYTVTNSISSLVTIQMGANDTTGVHFGPHSLVGAGSGGSLTLNGGGFSLSNAGNTDDALHLFFGTTMYLTNITLTGNAAHSLISLEHGASIFVMSGVTFAGTTGGSHMVVRDSGSSLEIDNNYTISGSTGFHAFCTDGGSIRTPTAITATISASITVTSFVIATNTGICDFTNTTFSVGANTVTGKRCEADGLGLAQSGTGTPNTAFPGNANCTTSVGGQAN